MYDTLRLCHMPLPSLVFYAAQPLVNNKGQAMNPTEAPPPSTADPDIWDGVDALFDERRRPGRPPNVNPTLMPLLRSTLTLDQPAEGEAALFEERGELAPASGFAVVLVLSLALWGAISLVAWLTLR